MTQLERAIFDAEGKLLDALWAIRMRNFEMSAHYADAAHNLIEAIGLETAKPLDSREATSGT